LAGKQKIHYTFTDGSEMVEEYDLRNYDLLGNIIFTDTVVILHNCCMLALRDTNFEWHIEIVVSYCII